jgi:hypothetical protein
MPTIVEQSNNTKFSNVHLSMPDITIGRLKHNNDEYKSQMMSKM